MHRRHGSPSACLLLAALCAACAPHPGARRLLLSGQDGNKTIVGTETVNVYAPLTLPAAGGDSKLTVASAAGFSAGDLIFVVATQGATFDTSDTASYGAVSALGAAGLHEWWLLSAVNQVNGELTLAPGCGLTGLVNAFPLTARPQVIRVPQYASLTVPVGTTLTGKAWDGSSGGYVVVHVEGAASILGAVDADGIGLRGGTVASGTGTIVDNVVDYRAGTAVGGEKGESIAGDATDYDGLGGRYGRGAPANGGGGGNGYLAGGGGGAGFDALSMNAYSGQGTMSALVTGGGAWSLDPGQPTAGGPGGGRGGYTLSAVDQDALTVAPGTALWGGNGRLERGGLGGHAPTTTGRLVLGGGGGAGHFDGAVPPAQGNAGRGGGVIYLTASSLTGTGTVHANGLAGLDGQLVGTSSAATVATGGGASGGGGGGIVILRATGNPALVVEARGGAGGALSVNGSFAVGVAAASGPGGGGGGGAVGLGTGLSLTTPPDVSAAPGGTTSAVALAEFPSNGASTGDVGLFGTGIAPTSPPIACLPADVQLTLADSADPVEVSSVFSVTATVLNGGPNAANDLSAVIALPSGTAVGTVTAPGWTCSQLGQQLTCLRPLLLANLTSTIVVALTAPITAGLITTTASLSSREDSDLTNNNASETTLVQLPRADLALTKTAPLATASAESFTYTLGVTNNGPRSAPSHQIVDTLPSGVIYVSAAGAGYTCTPSGATVTCTHGALANGATASVDLTVTAPALTSATDVINNATVSVTSSGTVDPASANDSASTTTSVRPVDLSISKTDLIDPVTIGGALAYTITVSNPATVAAHGVVVSDPLPTGTSFVSATGSGWTCSLVLGTIECSRPSVQAAPTATPAISIMLSAPATAGLLSNTASVTATATDPVLGNNTANQQTTIAPPPPGSADLSVGLVDATDPVLIGATADYTISVSNAGPDPAAGAQVVGTLPAGSSFVSATGAGWTCTQAGSTLTCVRSAPLPTGAAPPIALQLTAPPVPAQLSLSIIVTASTPDPAVANNSDVESTTVLDPTATNQPPGLLLPETLSLLEDNSLTLSASLAPVLADPDAGTAEVELRVLSTACVLTLSGTVGLTLLVGDGVLDPALTVRGSVAAINAALDSSIITPEPNFSGSAALAFLVDDLGHTGAGGSKQVARTLLVTVIAVNDPPTAVDDRVELPGDQTTPIDVLANDRAGEIDQQLSLVSLGSANHGGLIVAQGQVAYTPTLGYLGDDQFEYTISDGTDQATATVHVHVGEPITGPETAALGGGGLGCSASPGSPGSGTPHLACTLLLLLGCVCRARRDRYESRPRASNHASCSPSASKTGVGA